MNSSNTVLLTLLTSIGMASAAFAAPVGRMHQCPPGWAKSGEACKERSAPSGGLSAAYQDVEQPRPLSRAEVRAELNAIRLADEERLAAAAQRTRTGD